MKRGLTILIAFTVIASLFSGCKKTEKNDVVKDDIADTSAVNNTTHLFAGKDDLGRVLGLTGDEGIPDYRADKEVGVFYFLWLGASSAEGPYDISKVMAKNPEAPNSSVDWLLAGGGASGARHWWGESLFGYYRSSDEWVIEKDIQMLTDAGIDFIAIDYSNAPEYPRQLQVLLKALDKYYKQGFNVPKVTFITKANSGKKIMKLYEDNYIGQPEYNHLWYRMDGKPMIVGNTASADISEECKAYLNIKYAQWPRENINDEGFPWMDFNRPQYLFGSKGDGKTIMSVSLAQHSGTIAFSSSALYGDDTNKTRSFHNGANDKSENAYLYGYNFAEQFEHAIESDADIIFVTGWNEWIATRQESWKDAKGDYLEDPIIFVDCADANSSRDMQPMNGGYGDNYYMQLINFVRRFKGCKITNAFINTASAPTQNTFDVKGEFSQWNSVSSYYLDYTDDIQNRSHKGFGTLNYEDTTGRNDLFKMKVTNDKENLYFYAETMSDIVGMDGDHCMSLFINSGKISDAWYGYDFVVNRKAAAADKLTIEKRSAEGKWETCGTLDYKMVGNRIQFSMPLSLIGYSENSFSLEFKWADNYQGEDDIWSFYKNGDAAPYGRLNYVYKGV